MVNFLFDVRVNPTPQSGIPVISGGQRVGSVLSIDESRLNNVTSREWSIVGGASIASTPTIDSTAYGGQYVQVETVSDEGPNTSPPVLVYSDLAEPSHNMMDDALVAIMPHTSSTHIAVASGAWSASATWLNGQVPSVGSNVLIPYGINVSYDMSVSPVLKYVRIDGVLDFARDRNTLIELDTLIPTRGSELIIGTQAENMPANFTAEIAIDVSTDIDMSVDPMLMSRGIVWQGKNSAWGAEKDPWIKTANDNAPMIGHTSLILERIPEGWEIGDTIVIPATRVTSAAFSETEERVISGFLGNQVFWDSGEPLIYNHDKQNVNSLRTDFQPAIANITRNIKIYSKDPSAPSHRQPHAMGMHTPSQTDLWRVELTGFGRTVKGESTPVGSIDGNGDFEVLSGSTFVQSPLTASSNINGRYGLHLHFVGFNKSIVDVINNCSVRGSPGWGIVHHSCEALMNKNCVYETAGSGIVGETGNETGSWSENWVVKLLNITGGSPKDNESVRGQRGDFAKDGYPMYFVGRELNMHDNYVGDGSVGYVGHHRWQVNSFTLPIDHNRDELTLQDLGGPLAAFGTMRPVDNPILGFSGNESAGMFVSGLFITKATPAQEHGWNTQLRDFKSWGYRKTGMEPEYIAQYAIIRPDCMPTDLAIAPDGNGINWGANTFQVAVINGRFENCNTAILFSTTGPSGDIAINGTYDANTPRCIAIGNEYINCQNEVDHPNSAFSFLHEVTAEIAPVEPSHDLPFIVGTNAGGTTGYLTNTVSGLLQDSVSSSGQLPKPSDESGVVRPTSSANANQRAASYIQSRDSGYHTFGGKNITVHPLYFGDRASGKAVKTWHGIEHTWGTPTGPNLGEYTVSANPPTITGTPSITTTVNTPASLDLTSFISDVDGGTPTVSVSHVRPAHGFVDFTGNTATYTPDLDFTGTDTFSVWIDDGQGNSTRVDINVDVDVTAAQTIAAGDWSLGQATGDAVLLTLGAMPDTGGRAVRKVEFTTDGGTTWKRLCFKWVAGGHIVSTTSADVALTSAQALADVQLRYVTDRADLIGSDSKSITLD